MTDSSSRGPDLSIVRRRTHVCKGCGYGISIARSTLPHCPMCRTTAWAPERESVRRMRIEAA